MKQEIIEAVKKDLLEHYRSRTVNTRRKEIGLSMMTFKRVMNGADINLDVAEILCKALKLDYSFDYMPMLRKLIVTRTQKEIADELGTSSVMVSYWLQGKMKPRLSMFITIVCSFQKISGMLEPGDEVWAWNNNDIKRTRGLYVAKHRTLNHGVRTREGLKYFDNILSVKVVSVKVKNQN